MQIHYGRASLAPLTRLPAFFVFPRQPVEAAQAASYVAQQLQASPALASAQAVVVLLDQVLHHAAQELQEQLQQQYQGAAQLVLSQPASRELQPLRGPGQACSGPVPAIAAAACCGGTAGDAAACCGPAEVSSQQEQQEQQQQPQAAAAQNQQQAVTQAAEEGKQIDGLLEFLGTARSLKGSLALPHHASSNAAVPTSH